MGQYNEEQFREARSKINWIIAGEADQNRQGNDQIGQRKTRSSKQKEYSEQYSFVLVTRNRRGQQN